MNKYIRDKLAKDFNIPPKHVEEIIAGFYRGTRYYLEHAEESKGGIMISKYMKFTIDPHREMRHIEQKLSEGQEPKRTKVFFNLIKYKHNKIKTSKRDGERQKKIQDYLAQRNEQESINVEDSTN